MLRQVIILTSFISLVSSLPSQAVPTSSQINETAQRLCEIPGESSSMTRNIYYQEVKKWVDDGSLTVSDIEDEEIRENLNRELIKEIHKTCPLQAKAINNKIWNIITLSNN
jgi:hypothetical protein